MYGKVFASLWDGSLRGFPDRQLVFIYLLAHAQADGTVEVVQGKIADDTGLEGARVVDAIAALERPDPDSRSGDSEGRALEPLDERRSWGWRIVNYQRYRKMASERDRQQQNLEAKRRQRMSASVSNGQQASAMSAQGEGEVDGEEVTPLVSEADREGENLESPPSQNRFQETPAEWRKGFPDFWQEYPRKVAKAAALQAYMRLTPRTQETYDLLIDGLRLWLRKEWNGRDPDKIPHAATWLNQRRYTDAQAAI